jgi:hypothetical protein
MRYRITVEPDYVSAELFDRKTAEETRAFLAAVAAECRRHQLPRVLISVQSSRPIFSVEKYGLSSFVELAVKFSGKIAVLGDSAESRIAQEYGAMLARLRGANVRTFRDKATAIGWLTDARRGPESGRLQDSRSGAAKRPLSP